MATTTRNLPRRYEDVERIARGAMSEVYRAMDTRLGRIVAVKVLAEPLAADGDGRQRFAREVRAAARVSGDPNIVTIYDVGDWHERPFFVMEYIDGSSLEARLREEERQPRALALRWLEQAAHGLDHAHANGVVHRDVKPGNLLVDRDDNVHVADFGIASATWLPSLTATGTVLGTSGYLAPEQATGERASPASDRYALAVVAYELLTGRRPFERESPTAEATAHVSEPVPSVAGHGDLPLELDAVFQRALAKRPTDRFPTCASFVAALREILDRQPRQTRAYPVASPRRRRAAAYWPLLAAVLGAALVVAVLLAVGLSGTAPPSRVATQPPRKPAPSEPDPHSLNDRGWSLVQHGRYDAALPSFQRAVRLLRDTGPADPYEGYANYNLGYTLLQLGNCAEAASPLQRAQTLEPERPEVSAALAAVQECLTPARTEHDNEYGKGKGKHKGHH